MSFDDLNMNTIDLDMKIFRKVEQVQFDNSPGAEWYDQQISTNKTSQEITFEQFKKIFPKLLAQAEAVPRIPHPVTYYSFSTYCSGQFIIDGVMYRFVVFLGFLGTVTRPDGKYGYFKLTFDKTNRDLK